MIWMPSRLGFPFIGLMLVLGLLFLLGEVGEVVNATSFCVHGGIY
jgi:hypothetical protein